MDAKQPVNKWKPNTNVPPSSSPPGVARLSKEISFSGELRGTGSVEIDGKFEGSIILEHQLRILQNGEVKADVEADEVEIIGKLVGDVLARKKIIIAKGGQMFGNIKASRVEVSDGAIFKGHMDMDMSSVPAKAVLPKPAEPKPPEPGPAKPSQPNLGQPPKKA